MRKSGEITVFLSLILICICSLLCGLLESARTAGARYYFKVAASSSMDSLLSQHHRELWSQYRLLALEYGTENQLEQEYKTFFEPYLNQDNFYPFDIENSKVQGIKNITQDQGKYLHQEIIDYMKYGIWEIDMTPQTVLKTWESVTEAKVVKGLTGSYRAHTKAALKLEKTVEGILDSLNNQENCYEKAMTALEQKYQMEFRAEARKLLRELEKLPGLVTAYEKSADRLDNVLAETKSMYLEKQNQISEQTIHLLEEEIAHYEEYTAADGERRLEIKRLVQLAESNNLLVKEAIKIMDQWEPDESEEESDESALWESVSSCFQNVQILKLPFQTGVKDTEKQNLLEQVEKIINFDLLTLVLPEGTVVSQGLMDKRNLLSQHLVRTEEEIGTLSDRLLVNEYCGRYFNAFSCKESKGDKDITYELEYLIAGDFSDEENLKKTVENILVIREGFNLLYLLSDPQKREEARVLATAIVGATGVVPLISITTFFILGVWALGEAIMDVKGLLDGKKVSLVKTASTWNLSLEDLLEIGKKGSAQVGEGDTEGLDYEGYLKLILLLKDPQEKYYRMMDLIQQNIRKKQEDFLLNQCAYSVDIKTTVCGKHVFSSLSLLKNLMEHTDARYQLQTSIKQSY